MESVFTKDLSVVLVKLEPSDQLNFVEESCHCRCCFKNIDFLEIRYLANGDSLQKFQKILNMPLESSLLASSFCEICYNEILRFSSFQELAVMKQKSFAENRNIYDIQQLTNAGIDFEIKAEPLEPQSCIEEVADIIEFANLKSADMPKTKRKTHAKCDYCPAHPYDMNKHLLNCSSKKKADMMEFVKFHRTKKRKALKKSRKPLTIPCQYCRYTTINKQKFKKHMELHSQKPKKKCDHCDFDYYSNFYLRKHMKEAHLEIQNNSEPNVCPSCGASFINHRSLDQHIKRVHENIRNYECDNCGKRFFSCTEFVFHWKGKHATEKISVCDLCGMSFATNNHLKKHMTTCHTDVSEYFNCKICEKKFSTVARINAHVSRVHARLKPFKCDVCAKAYFRREELESHQLKHKGIKFKCYVPGCPSAVTRKSVLIFHMKNNHSLSPDEQREFMKKLDVFCSEIQCNR